MISTPSDGGATGDAGDFEVGTVSDASPAATPRAVGFAATRDEDSGSVRAAPRARGPLRGLTKRVAVFTGVRGGGPATARAARAVDDDLPPAA